MSYQRRQRNIINSFAEGLIAPWVELVVSLCIVVGSKAIETLSDVLQQLFYQLSNTASVGLAVPIDFVTVFSFAILVMSIIDLVRNLVVGFLYPGHAVAHIVGEIISLTFIAFVPISKGIVMNSLLVVMFLVVGVLFRFYVEYKESETECWIY